MRIQFIIFFFFAALTILPGRDCEYSISGYIKDKSTDIPLEYASIFIEETQSGVVTDSLGYFEIDYLCAGTYHLVVTHLGCSPEHVFLELTRDTIVTFHLQHHSELLDEVVVHGSREGNTAQQSNVINRDAITSEGNKNLSDILEQVAGVSSLKSGSGISKPVVHGLYGNRVSILNNGISQAGQQWGNDHAPEIDPFVADHLSVIKGVGALAYSGNALGSVITVESAPIKKDPHIHGEVNYIFQSNGNGQTANVALEKNGNWAAWRLSGTFKKFGDLKTPGYYLTNTGKQENNAALQIEKRFSKKWNADLYYSFFDTSIGILRGSHIGNLTDLTTALGKEGAPFFTEDKFSFNIAAPRQEVTHHLLKLSAKYIIDDNRVLKFKYGGQINQREEFDVRRNNRTDIPALSLFQHTHFFESVLNVSLDKGYFIKSGLQFNIIDNTNNPETGILPLIPDYRTFHGSAFFITQKETKKFFYEGGFRYDLKNPNVVTITQSLPHEIERFNHVFHNYSVSGGIKAKITDHFSSNFNIGYMLRAPEVNELYSFGLHQGVSGIEEGSRSLSSEKSLKLILSGDMEFSEKLFLQVLGYFQNINDFIYLQPHDEYRLTIRGAFPVFVYQQTDANIYGADFTLKLEPVNVFDLLFRYAIVRGRDLTNDLFLINMPSDNISSNLNFHFQDGDLLQNKLFSINAKYVFRQNNIEAGQDFTETPEAYFLLGASIGTSVNLNSGNLKFAIKADNILNAKYRDYLNRFRYFADEPGINISFNANYTF